jgi:uncharacterized protein
MRNSKKSNMALNVMISRLKKYYKPELVILFGSRANGSFAEDSDIDLLIVKNTSKRPLLRRIDVRKILATDRAVDVIVYTPSEFANLKNLNSSFIDQVMKEGEILYEKQRV